MEALAQGIVESAQEAMVRHVTGQAAYLAGLLEATGVPIVVPGAHGVFVDAKRFLPHIPQTQFPAQTLAAAIYLAGGCAQWSAGSSRASTATSRMTGWSSSASRSRAGSIREHLDYVAETLASVLSAADELPVSGSSTSRSTPLLPGALRAAAPFPDFSAERVLL